MACTTNQAGRREFLRRLGALGVMGQAAPFALNLAALGQASAQSATSDYRALVCVFLYGGNDAYNTVLATDPESWSAYTSTRRQEPDSIALLKDVAADPSALPGTPAALGGVLPIGTQQAHPGRSFALHPLLRATRQIYEQGRLAIVSNVGPLLRPTTKANVTAFGFPLPAKLYSHNDQQSTWQAFGPEGASIGWGGRLADLLLSQNPADGTLFSAVSAAGNAVWLAGRDVAQYPVSPTGVESVGQAGTVYGSALSLNAVLRSMYGQSTGGTYLESALRASTVRSFTATAKLSGALPGAFVSPHGTAGAISSFTDPLLMYDDPLTGGRGYNPLAHQLQMVSRVIQSRQTLGMKRQVFFVGLNGFDTHADQNASHARLMAQLDHALSYFYVLLAQLGLLNQVTTFTASDFGRGFSSNGDGSDHGWGGHCFVMGGAVKGGSIYGSFPAYSVPNTAGEYASPDQVTNGSMLPTLAVDQYAATLGAWMGASATGLLDVLPNLGQFSQRDLGFLTL